MPNFLEIHPIVHSILMHHLVKWFLLVERALKHFDVVVEQVQAFVEGRVLSLVGCYIYCMFHILWQLIILILINHIFRPVFLTMIMTVFSNRCPQRILHLLAILAITHI